MKKLWICMICLLFPLGLIAQERAEYNQKGDDAMRHQDYSEAKMWYEEGVALCDMYSIQQLTLIWLSNERRRTSMRSLMNKCLNCLKVKATDDDMEAISKLITYYTEGIGTSKNEELAAYWIDYRKALLNPAEPEARDTVRTTSRKRMDFFAGYVYSIESPYGITVGGIGQRFGWYVRFKTNMSFSDYAEDCNDAGEIIDFSGSESYEPNTARSSKTNSVAGTVGLIVKCCPWLYVSAGLGYGERALLHSFKTHTYENYNDSREIWCKNVDSSYSGVAVEMDVMIKLTNFLYISAGCNTISFNYADLNAGVGIFF